MKYEESYTVELKQEVNADFKKEIINNFRIKINPKNWEHDTRWNQAGSVCLYFYQCSR